MTIVFLFRIREWTVTEATSQLGGVLNFGLLLQTNLVYAHSGAS